MVGVLPMVHRIWLPDAKGPAKRAKLLGGWRELEQR